MINVTFTAGQTDYVGALNALVAQINATAPGATWAASGRMQKNVAGAGPVNLTVAECFNQFIEFTGAITANMSVRFPAQSGSYFVVNNTTGAFTLTCTTLIGSGVVIPLQKLALIQCDGTNVLSPITYIADGLTVAGAFVAGSIPSPGPIGGTTPSTGAFSSTSVAQVTMSGWNAISGSNSANGQINVGSASGGIALVGDASGSGNAFVDGTFDNASGAIVFRLRTAGTPLVGMKLGTTSLTPGADNIFNFGSGALRWKEIFSATGTINTSDARTKTPVSALNDSEVAASVSLAREIGTYQFLDALQEKGDAARRHIGLTVQRAMEILREHGLDPFAYGFICYDKWDDQFVDYPAIPAQTEPDGSVTEYREARREQAVVAGDSYGFRGNELLLFIARGFGARLAALEACVRKLETASWQK